MAVKIRGEVKAKSPLPPVNVAGWERLKIGERSGGGSLTVLFVVQRHRYGGKKMMTRCDLHEVNVDRRGCPWCQLEEAQEQVAIYKDQRQDWFDEAEKLRNEKRDQTNYDGHDDNCDCAVCDDIAFRRSLRGTPYTEPAAMELLRQKVQAKHDANCLLRLLLETLPIQLEKHNLTHDRTACAMLIQDSIDYLFRDGEDTLVESPSNDEQQMLKLAYTMGQTTEQKLSEHLRKELEDANKSLDEYRACVDKWRLWYDNASEDAKKWRRDAQTFYGALVKIAEYHGTKDEVWANDMRAIAKEALADRP